MILLELIGVAAFAVTGAMAAMEVGADVFGVLFLSLVTALGGGIIRDVIMQVGNVYVLTSRWAIPVSLAAGILGFAFPSAFQRFPRLLEWVDVISMGLFVASGTDKALAYSLHAVACVLMGLLTGVGGGALRDVFLGEVPRVFERSNLYALCAVAGSVAYYACIAWLHLRRPWAAVICVAVTLGLRRLSLRYNILSPANVDLTPQVAMPARKVAGKVRRYVLRRRGGSRD